MTDLPRLLTKRREQYRNGARRGEILICCPFCVERGESQDTRFRLSINYIPTATGDTLGNCFNCGWGSHKAVAYLLRHWQLPQADWGNDLLDADDKPIEPVHLPEDFTRLTNPRIDWEEIALDYVLRRGITKEQIHRHKIGVSLIGRYAYRIVFPIYKDKRLHGIVGRDFTGKREPRYLFNVGEKALYGMRQGTQRVVLAEGVFKALRLAQALPCTYSCIAMLGHTLTEVQQAQLADVEEAVLWLDPDNVGVRGGFRVASALQAQGTQVSFVLPEKPADDVPLWSLRRSFKARQPFSYGTRLAARLGGV